MNLDRGCKAASKMVLIILNVQALVILSSWMWPGLTDIFLLNGTWQKLWDITCKLHPSFRAFYSLLILSCKKTVASILGILFCHLSDYSPWEKPVGMLSDIPVERPRYKDHIKSRLGLGRRPSHWTSQYFFVSVTANSPHQVFLRVFGQVQYYFLVFYSAQPPELGESLEWEIMCCQQPCDPSQPDLQMRPQPWPMTANSWKNLSQMYPSELCPHFWSKETMK